MRIFHFRLFFFLADPLLELGEPTEGSSRFWLFGVDGGSDAVPFAGEALTEDTLEPERVTRWLRFPFIIGTAVGPFATETVG